MRKVFDRGLSLLVAVLFVIVAALYINLWNTAREEAAFMRSIAAEEGSWTK